MPETLLIRKVNEVYNQIYTPDMGIAQELSEYFTFKVPGSEFSPQYRNKIWDGKIRLYNMRNQTLYAGLNHYVENFARERNYEVVYEYDRSALNFSKREAIAFLKDENFTMEPRDYQIKAFVDGVRVSRGLFLSPTASGKSFIIYMLMRYHLRPTLIVVPTTTLTIQMKTDFLDYTSNEYQKNVLEKMTAIVSEGAPKDQSYYKITFENNKTIYLCYSEKVKLTNGKMKKVVDLRENDDLCLEWLSKQKTYK